MLNITLPQLEKQKKAKDLIISILAMKYPLGSKKIYNEIKRRYGYSVTYQAVHKCILQLLEQGVLVKEDMEYYINMQWIDEVSNFVERMKESYNKKKYPFGIIDMQTSENMQMIVFSDFLGAEFFNLKLLDNYLSNPKNKEPFCVHIQHIKRPIFQSEQAYETLKILKKTKVEKYILVRGNTIIDKWCVKFYEEAFNNCILGVDVAKDYETHILGDTVTQLYIPPEVSRKIDFEYNNSKRIRDVKMPRVYSDIYERKCKVQLLIYKNPEIAEQLRQKTLNYFK